MVGRAVRRGHYIAWYIEGSRLWLTIRRVARLGYARIMDDSRHAGMEAGKMPSERNFGYTVGGILLAIACLRSWWHSEVSTTSTVMGVIAAALLVLAAFQPDLLKVPNRLWMKLGDILFRVVNPIVMLLIYITTFVPIGLLMRLTGKDPLQKGFDKSADSYWILRDNEPGKASSMTNQF
jgi:hypothetical protein